MKIFSSLLTWAACSHAAQIKNEGGLRKQTRALNNGNGNGIGNGSGGNTCVAPSPIESDKYCNVVLVAKYTTINADGAMLRVPLFNATMPGPAIRCKVKQTLRVTVINEMQSEELSVNWHGIANENNNINDGVAYVTEYPISPGGGSRVYEVVLNKEGTFSYNAYQEFLKMSMHGIIIVDSPTCDPLISTYDEEAVVIQPSKRTSATYPAIVATDWYHHTSGEITSQLFNNLGDWIWQPQSAVVNGYGMYNCTTSYEYYFRCAWQCPADDMTCIDEVRCSKSRHPFNNNTLGPYIFEEMAFDRKFKSYNELTQSGKYSPQVQETWAKLCGWDHIAPFLAGGPFNLTADGVEIGKSGQRHQNQFNNWGRPTVGTCDATKPQDQSCRASCNVAVPDPRCDANKTWVFKGLNKERIYDHLRNDDGTYDIHHFDDADMAQYGALCRPTRFYTGDVQPEGNHNPFGLWGQSRRQCRATDQAEKAKESPAIIEVEFGKTYRLRVNSLATLLYMTMVIEGHSMTIVQADADYLEPFTTNFLDLWNGQSYSVIFTADAAEQKDYWIGFTHRHRGYTRIDPGRMILRYVTKSGGVSTPVGTGTGRLPNSARPVPKYWDAAKEGAYLDADSGAKPTACPKALHKYIFDAGNTCPGFYPNVYDQDISMLQQYKFKARSGYYPLPNVTDPTAAPVMIVQNMNANFFDGIESYNSCSDDYGSGTLKGNYVQGYSWIGNSSPDDYDVQYGRFRPNTDLAGAQSACGKHRWSVNNITRPKHYYDPSYKGTGAATKPLLYHVYAKEFDALTNVVDVKRPDETPYLKSFDWYQSISPSYLGGNQKETLNIYPSSHELINVMKFPLHQTIDIVMQNTVYLRFWTNALYGDKHSHRTGSNMHPYHSHGFDHWTLGYGEGNFNLTAWKSVSNLGVGAPPVVYRNSKNEVKGMIHFKNMVNPPKKNTVLNFAGGWTVLRIQLDNPGIWEFHCTAQAHFLMGMGFYFGVDLDNVKLPNARSLGCDAQPALSL